MNEYDSAAVSEMFLRKGWVSVPENEADVIIVNTCAVRQNAENRALGRLLTLAGTYPESRVGIIGCVAQEIGKKLLEKYPKIAFAVGPGEIHRLPEIIAGFDRSAHLDVDCLDGKGLRAEIKSGSVKAFIAISRGCENFCSYCIVPYVRGKLRGRPMSDIIEEIKRDIDLYVVEITLLGQNVNSYIDPETGADFAELLEKVDAIDGLRRIRFVTNHPKDMSERVIEAISCLPHVCESIHLPVQSGSSKILKLMNRGYSREKYLDIVRKIREKMPDIALTTDIITGFPGEADEDFQDTVTLYREVGYAGAFAFRYSPRPGTAASNMIDDVPEKLKIERLTAIIDMSQKFAEKFSKSLIGKNRKILVEGESAKNPGMVFGLDRAGRKVILPGKKDLRGQIVNVIIDRAEKWFLFGTKI